MVKFAKFSKSSLSKGQEGLSSNVKDTETMIYCSNYQANFDPSKYDELFFIFLELLSVYPSNKPLMLMTNPVSLKVSSKTVAFAKRSSESNSVVLDLVDD
ncbi:hypothetical protein L1887_34976 [Cichorium endivia]|nr:hypothetical protein L1887_34976 [Cichorium endivia]